MTSGLPAESHMLRWTYSAGPVLLLDLDVCSLACWVCWTTRSGRGVVVNNVDRPSVAEFRYSWRRHLLAISVVLAALAATVAAVTLRFDEPWWRFLQYGWPGFTAGVIVRWLQRRQPKLPLRLTDEGLHVTGPDGSRLTIDRANLAHATVRGWLDPRLIVEPTDPQRTRPPLRPHQWPAPGQRRPYELVVRINFMTPGRDMLRRELARRFPTPAA